MHPAQLTDLLFDLRSAVGVPLHVQPASSSDVLTLQVGDNPDAVVGITVLDADRPSYSVSYPALSLKRNGDRVVGCRRAEGVLREGLVWIVRQLAEHGMVVPEHGD